jgi:tryptophanyl-tRNA synthetase
MKNKVVLTGMRPTGKLHLGHYVGALKQWKEIQDGGKHECFFLVADIQALTTHADRPELLKKSIKEVVLDWLSIGLDPKLPHVHFVLQSQVLGRYELSGLFGMIAKYGEVMRNPTLKDELKKQKNASMGFMYYPVDQIADIHMVDPMKKNAQLLVPVGQDQLAHLELAREVVRRFNSTYGEVFTECEGLVGEIGRLVGTDGDAKMSKSLGNTINLADDEKTVNKAIDLMAIDPSRSVKDGHTLPGDPEKCVAIIYHRAFNEDKKEVAEMESLYKLGNIGDGDIKQRLKVVLNNFLDPIRQKRQKYIESELSDVLRLGTSVAQKVASNVAKNMREKMSLDFPK